MAQYEFENQHFDYAMWSGENYFQCFEDGEYLSYTANGTVNDALWEYMQENSIEIRPMRPDYHIWNGSEWVLEETAFFAAKLDEYEVALDEHINGIVRNLKDENDKPYRFTNIVSAVSYNRPGSFRQDVAAALADWRDEFWDAADIVYLAVKNGDRPFPDIEVLKAELPAFVWPPVGEG